MVLEVGGQPKFQEALQISLNMFTTRECSMNHRSPSSSAFLISDSVGMDGALLSGGVYQAPSSDSR